jgi:hypothetical protein
MNRRLAIALASVTLMVLALERKHLVGSRPQFFPKILIPTDEFWRIA